MGRHKKAFSLLLVLTTDASKYDYGAVLSQKIKGVEKVIFLWSKKATPWKAKYDRNCMEIIILLPSRDAFKFCLYGKNFILRVDDQVLKHVFSATYNGPRGIVMR